ncbi:MAG: hypothetical protein COB66_09265 [Coxiella sp. (in: Bacteria)]|nr:MAG: hypothetical protein COB66_09265 [Coxiella sp. (in: g-proteobacteria)]
MQTCIGITIRKQFQHRTTLAACARHGIGWEAPTRCNNSLGETIWDMMAETADNYNKGGLALLKSGQYSSAFQAFGSALDLEPRNAFAHYHIGISLLLEQQNQAAIPCLLTAHQMHPRNTNFNIGFAKAIRDSGDPERASSFLASVAALEPSNDKIAHAASFLPLTKSMAGNFHGYASHADPSAVQSASRALYQRYNDGDFSYCVKHGWTLVWQCPENVVIWKVLADSARHVSKMKMAETCIRRAVSLAPKDIECTMLLSKVLRATDRAGSAIDLLKSAYQAQPSFSLLESLCQIMDEAQQSSALFELLDTCAPNHPDKLSLIKYHQARALMGMRDTAGAHAAYKEALSLAPLDPLIVAGAAIFYETLTDSSHFLELMQRARDDDLPFETARLLEVDAMARLREGKPDLARASILRSIDILREPDDAMRCYYRLGQVEDKAGNYRAAFKAFSTANKLAQDIFNVRAGHKNKAILGQISLMRAAINSQNQFRQLEPVARPGTSAKIGFLVGFPRSGTTLLDTILRSHSHVEVIEEMPTLTDAGTDLMTKQGIDVAFQNSLELDPGTYREVYLEKLSQLSGLTLSEDKLYIDKNPLNTRWAPLLHKLFPEAVFIFSVRHPLDVAISNFGQNFILTDAMTNMTSLGSIDHLYDQCFSLWHEFDNLCKPNVERVTYEELVEDLEGTVSRIMKRFGLEWEDAQARFFETALKRGRVYTASQNQVTQKLYTTSKERWRNYEFAFKGDDTANLRKWAVKLGYSID